MEAAGARRLRKTNRSNAVGSERVRLIIPYFCTCILFLPGVVVSAAGVSPVVAHGADIFPVDGVIKEENVAAFGADVSGFGDGGDPKERDVALASGATVAMRSDDPAVAADRFGIGIEIAGDGEKGTIGKFLG